jgi:hypothetical protein
MAQSPTRPQEVVMSAQSHRSRRTALASVAAAVAIAVLPALANARPVADHGVPAIPVNAPGTDVAAQDQQVQRQVVNAPGTDVAAQDQQAQRPVVNAPGTNVAAADQQAPIVDNPGPVSPADGPDDTMPTILLLALIALGVTLAGLGLASRLAATRRRHRAAA